MIVQHLTPSARDLSIIQEHTDTIAPTKSEQSFKDITVNKPWGEEYLLFENEDTAIWILTINPENGTSCHAHPNKTTSLIILEGQAECHTLMDRYNLHALEAIILGKKVFHQTRNSSSESLYVMEIESPVNKHDLIRYKDAYGRQGKAYESKNRFQASPGSYLSSGLKVIGSTDIIIEFAVNMNSFFQKVSPLHNAVITILNRNIWSNDGEKLIEVGNSFKLEDIEKNFLINDNFYYVIIHKKQ